MYLLDNSQIVSKITRRNSYQAYTHVLNEEREIEPKTRIKNQAPVNGSHSSETPRSQPIVIGCQHSKVPQGQQRCHDGVLWVALPRPGNRIRNVSMAAIIVSFGSDKLLVCQDKSIATSSIVSHVLAHLTKSLPELPLLAFVPILHIPTPFPARSDVARNPVERPRLKMVIGPTVLVNRKGRNESIGVVCHVPDIHGHRGPVG